MNFKDRISEVIKDSGLTASEFADLIDVPRSSISHISSGRNKPSLDFLIKIKEQFPNIEWEWLIKGEGDKIILKNKPEQNLEKNTVPSPLPNLFSVIEKEDFGVSKTKENQSESRQIQNPLDSHIMVEHSSSTAIEQSHQLEKENKNSPVQNTEKQGNKIKRIVLFFENGTFESFES